MNWRRRRAGPVPSVATCRCSTTCRRSTAWGRTACRTTSPSNATPRPANSRPTCCCSTSCWPTSLRSWHRPAGCCRSTTMANRSPSRSPCPTRAVHCNSTACVASRWPNMPIGCNASPAMPGATTPMANAASTCATARSTTCLPGWASAGVNNGRCRRLQRLWRMTMSMSMSIRPSMLLLLLLLLPMPMPICRPMSNAPPRCGRRRSRPRPLRPPQPLPQPQPQQPRRRGCRPCATSKPICATTRDCRCAAVSAPTRCSVRATAPNPPAWCNAWRACWAGLVARRPCRWSSMCNCGRCRVTPSSKAR